MIRLGFQKNLSEEEIARKNAEFERFYAECLKNPNWETDEMYDERLWEEYCEAEEDDDDEDDDW